MVDYVIHVLMKYFELIEEKSPLFDGSKDKVIEAAISTMGSGVLIAGCTTILSTLPLAFSKASVIKAIFIIFFSFVLISLVHALVLVPVLLSLFGPKPPTEEDLAVEVGDILADIPAFIVNPPLPESSLTMTSSDAIGSVRKKPVSKRISFSDEIEDSNKSFCDESNKEDFVAFDDEASA